MTTSTKEDSTSRPRAIALGATHDDPAPTWKRTRTGNWTLKIPDYGTANVFQVRAGGRRPEGEWSFGIWWGKGTGRKEHEWCSVSYPELEGAKAAAEKRLGRTATTRAKRSTEAAATKAMLARRPNVWAPGELEELMEGFKPGGIADVD